ncbi:MAG: 8-oxoguanine deaminase [Rhizobiales bacterium]|nr:8-oxoguanine deaminase [Hyphomicrobiales bacterium]
MAIWIKNPRAILAENADGGILVDKGRIIELIPIGAVPVATPDEVFEARDLVIVPGLINTHHHFYQSLTRTLPGALNQELFGWLTALYPVWANLEPEFIKQATRLVLAELVLSGCTTTTDHHYVFPPGTEDAIDIQVAEVREMGMRAVLTRGSMNLSQKDGGLPPDSVVQDMDVILADSERLVAKYHETGADAFIQIALAPCSPFSVTRALMQETAQLAEQKGVLLHTHLAETKDETAFCRERFGCTPVEYLEETGWLGPRTWLAHGIHFSEQDIKRLGKADVAVSSCSCSNMHLASGMCPVCDLEAAGAKIGLGIDGSASNDASNMIEEVRQAFLLQRLNYGAAKVSHLDALRWATAGSADCIRRPDLGRIEIGANADLAMFKLDEMRHSGGHDPLATLVICGASRAEYVMIGGNWIVEKGAIPGLDTKGLIAAHTQAARKLVAKTG